MAADLEGIVGRENMDIAAKERVIQILRGLPTSAIAKRYFYSRWARLLGRVPTPEDLDQVAPWSQQ